MMRRNGMTSYMEFMFCSSNCLALADTDTSAVVWKSALMTQDKKEIFAFLELCLELRSDSEPCQSVLETGVTSGSARQ